MKVLSLLTFMAASCLLATPLKAQNRSMKLKITVGNKEFGATLNAGEAAEKLIGLLPLDVTMAEHNGNEKYYDLPHRMPGTATSVGRVEAGELMVWSSSTLVLFYAGARTSYSYIRLGKIDDPSGLREAAGRGSVRVKFESVGQ